MRAGDGGGVIGLATNARRLRSVGLQADVSRPLVGLEADAPKAAASAAQLAERLSARGVRLQWRSITDGDAEAFPDPTEPLARRRASGAARVAARIALAALGFQGEAPLPRTPRRYPLWPAGFAGSLAHDEALAVALVAPARRFAALGVDVEPVEPLPNDVAGIALLPAERRAAAADPALSRAIFAAKEAVYKAINPFDGTPLEYEDIEVDLAARRARLRDGRSLELDFARGERWIVAALAPAMRDKLSRAFA